MVGNKYAVALVGYGGMGHWHARLLKEFDEIFLYGIYDINPEKLAAAKADPYAISMGKADYPRGVSAAVQAAEEPFLLQEYRLRLPFSRSEQIGSGICQRRPQSGPCD